jgi:hypothetical protein
MKTMPHPQTPQIGGSTLGEVSRTSRHGVTSDAIGAKRVVVDTIETL